MVGDIVVELEENGHEKYSMDHIIHGLRLAHHRKFRSTSDYKLDDDHSSYLARWKNESMDFPFFSIRSVKGEPRVDYKGRVLVVAK